MFATGLLLINKGFLWIKVFALLPVLLPIISKKKLWVEAPPQSFVGLAPQSTRLNK
ncbi:hypothetical protein TOL_2712 [Thalassolituus oleivorans MIL-1]|uniref:Uncharacterized protein n=2 Tax=root TaxID=1 RepID=M5E6L8_9GAMM|nr:hypothetical protein TOL_2712 [Thalassolituus oleivorans MIL-1]